MSSSRHEDALCVRGIRSLLGYLMMLATVLVFAVEAHAVNGEGTGLESLQIADDVFASGCTISGKMICPPNPGSRVPIKYQTAFRLTRDERRLVLDLDYLANDLDDAVDTSDDGGANLKQRVATTNRITLVVEDGVTSRLIKSDVPGQSENLYSRTIVEDLSLALRPCLVLWGAGRGYLSEMEPGLVELPVADGDSSRLVFQGKPRALGATGKWSVVVESSAGYIVSEAEFRLLKNNELKLKVKNANFKKGNGITFPSQGEATFYLGPLPLRYEFTFSDASNHFDEHLWDECRTLVNSKLPRGSFDIDRTTSPSRTLFTADDFRQTEDPVVSREKLKGVSGRIYLIGANFLLVAILSYVVFRRKFTAS